MSDKPEVRIVSLSRMHTIMWYCLLVWVLLTSFLAGHLYGSGADKIGLPMFILLGNLTLGATMAAISRRKDLK